MKHIYCILFFGLMIISSFAQSSSVEISHYLFPEFTHGVVLMKTGVQQKTLLNYNSLTEEMIYDNYGTKLAIANDSFDKIDTIFIKDKKFILVENKFFELIYHSKFNLFVEHKCSATPPGKPAAFGGTSQTSASTSVSTISSQGMKYDLKLPDGYDVQPYIYYWILKNGVSQKFANMKQLKKMYQNKIDLLNAYLKQHNVKYDNQESITQLIKYLESN